MRPWSEGWMQERWKWVAVWDVLVTWAILTAGAVAFDLPVLLMSAGGLGLGLVSALFIYLAQRKSEQ